MVSDTGSHILVILSRVKLITEYLGVIPLPVIAVTCNIVLRLTKCSTLFLDDRGTGLEIKLTTTSSKGLAYLQAVLKR